jgi:hypothetical protein
LTDWPAEAPVAAGVPSATHFGGAAFRSPLAFSVLQSGVAPCVVGVFLAAGAAGVEVCARTGVARPRIAAVAMLLMKGLRIMFFLL